MGVACLFGAPVAALATEASTKAHVEHHVVKAKSATRRARQSGGSEDVVSATAIAAHQMRRVTDLAQFAPGVNLAGSYGGQEQTLSIRGLSQQDFSPIAESPNAFYLDGAYVVGANAASIALFDTADIAVRMGPQGTDGGRNALGGSVAVASRAPTLAPEGYVSVGHGSFDDTRVEAAYGGSILRAVSARLAGYWERNGAVWRNLDPAGQDLGASQSYGLRAAFDVHPGGAFRTRITAIYTRAFSSWGPYLSLSTRNVLSPSGALLNSVVVSQPTLLGTKPSSAQALEMNSDAARDRGDHVSLYGAVADSHYDLHGLDLRWLSSAIWQNQRLQIDADATPVAFFNSNTPGASRTVTEELSLGRSAGRLRWRAGVYEVNTDVQVSPDSEMILPYRIDSAYGLSTNGIAGFANGAYAFTRTLTLNAGIRLTDDRKQFTYRSDLFTAGGASLGPARGSYRGTINDLMPTGEIRLDWHIRPDTLLYAGFARGAQSGGFNAPFAGGTTYPDSQIPYHDEAVNAWEIGAKQSLLHDRLNLKGALFYEDFPSLQVFRLIRFTGSQVTNNPATFKGGEVSADWHPDRHWSLQATGSYVDAQVFDNIITGLSYTRRPPYTSKFHASGMIRYAWPAFGGTAALEAGAAYTSTYYLSLTNFDATRVRGYVLTSATASWQGRHGLKLAINGQNLGDVRYESVGFDLSGLCGCSQIAYGPPRWVMGTVSQTF
ncbi:TonB-dependent receptor [Tanticharoenia sakaeratensis]|uniref:TonB-dependent receptor n=1 Tax=Tanticharoenia sakaeratensis NBRC 103193 TaxID=1231623 RepID=A0A0D6MND6_9PROT|nr:TonB-dependent receptor [Tanticharoenia sakaeratensis]GAN54915.1 TonB-dependent receptor [Tanticharoenia sakaeratensis NBRC 103193]GBQ23522.1 TonB-dependent receptor [Tanticharoenia sakaeratensis NBRC 103193]